MSKPIPAWRLTPLLLVVVTAGQGQSTVRAEGEAIAVRFAEGAVHGFLELRTATGNFLSSGDLLQRQRGDVIESSMVFRFPDSSLFDESVSFSQRGHFTLLRYRLIQRGPAFARDIDAAFDGANGNYRVVWRDRGGQPDSASGTLDLPADVYNGMVILVAKNLAPRDTQRIHIVAFTPKPRLIGLELAPDGSQQLRLGGVRSEHAVRYAFKPKLGTVLGIAARVTGRFPPDSHTWILKEDVPSFVRFQGPLYDGPAWRIDVISPRWATR